MRVLAPLVNDKLSDPAVVVIDERARHVISLLSGHAGGANALTRYLAGMLGADPVITTATDVNELAALDTLAVELNARMKMCIRDRSWIVGRDTTQLQPQQINRAVVETVAENTVDGIIAPLFFLLSLIHI